MGQFTHNGVTYEELPNGKVKAVAYANPLAGATPIGGVDPRIPLQVQGDQLSNQSKLNDLGNAPIERTGKVLGNQRTAQDITLDRVKLRAELKKQFASDPAVLAYRTVLPQVADAMSQPNTAAGDLAIVYAFGKVMDPSSSVREGEMDMAQGTSPLMGQIQAYVGRIKSGKRLPAETRVNLIEAMRNRAGQYNQAFGDVGKSYASIATQAGFKPEEVVGEHPGKRFLDVEKRYIEQHKAPQASYVKDKTYVEHDPKVSGLIDSLVRNGVPYEQARQQIEAAGGAPGGVTKDEYNAAVGYARKNPDFKGSFGDATVERQQTTAQKVAGFVDDTIGSGDLPGIFKGAIGSWDRAANMAETGLNAIPGVDLSAAHEADAQHDQYFQDIPTSRQGENIGRLMGAGVLSAPVSGAMTAGALGNLLMTDSQGMDAAMDAGSGALGGKLGDWAIRGGAQLIAPEGREALKRLASEGVEFSPGQTIGGFARKMEDRLTGLPVVGPKIEAMRDKSMAQANLIPAKRSLAPIGETLPEGINPGHEAVSYTQDRLGQFYNNTLQGQNVAIDPTYITRLNAVSAGAGLPDEQFGKLANIFDREVGQPFAQNGGALRGSEYKKVDSRLGSVASDLGRSENIYDRDLGNVLGQVKDQTRALARRQSPEMASNLRAADEGWANFKIYQKAATANPATGMFGAGQLRSAVRQGDRSFSKGATARGEATMQDLASDMSEALPSSLGSSGTSEREQVAKFTPWAIGSALSPLFSEQAAAAAQKLLLRDPGALAKLTANRLRSLPRGMFGAGLPLMIESGQGY